MQSLFGASQACYLLLPKFLTIELAATPPEIGAVGAMYSAVNVVLLPAVGVGVDRLGRRAFLLMGNAISLLASVAFVWIDSVGPAVFVLRGLQGDPAHGWCNVTPPRPLIEALDALFAGGGR